MVKTPKRLKGRNTGRSSCDVVVFNGVGLPKMRFDKCLDLLGWKSSVQRADQGARGGGHNPGKAVKPKVEALI